MRYKLDLSRNWWVSASPDDAILAIKKRKWQPEMLVYAGDQENYPRKINLPGGPQFGKRDAPPAKAAMPADAAFVGKTPLPPQQRLPTPFLNYAKCVRIPAAWQNRKIFLHLDNVRYLVTVKIDGHLIGHYAGGLEPRAYDITRHATPGRAISLLITVGDASVSGHRCFDAYNYTGNRLPTCKEIENNLTHPVVYGGADRAVGNVQIEAVPLVRVEYVFAKPSVKKRGVFYTVALRNDTHQRQTLRVRSHASSRARNTPAKTLIDMRVTLAPASRKLIKRFIPWPDAILWDMDHPHLYDLRTTVISISGKVWDKHRDYFGFREFRIDGADFILNGKKIHLHGQSGHTSPDHDWMTLRQKISYLKAWKERGHITHLRLHARPQHKEWVLAADRVGLLVTTETALWTTNFHSLDWAGAEEECLNNIRHHFFEALVRRDRNNPSVVIWSLSNEMSPITPWDLSDPHLGSKMRAMSRIFARIIAEAQREDNSRVIQMSSAMDFLGRLAMYNIHYPKPWQSYPDYPHTAYWLEKPFLFPWYGAGRPHMPAWRWRRDKPLYFGEFLCVHGATPDMQATIIGDIAFARKDFGTSLVCAKLWPLEIQAYRRYDVSGFCAWSCLFPECKDVDKRLAKPHVKAHSQALRPLAVLCHSFRQHYLAGDEAEMALSLHNDTRRDMLMQLICTLGHGRKIIWQEEMPPRTMSPASVHAFACRLKLPLSETRSVYSFRAVLKSGRKTLDILEKNIDAWPRNARLHLPADMCFFDPDGFIAARFAERGITGGRYLQHPALSALENERGIGLLWLHFPFAKISQSEWQAAQRFVLALATKGAIVVFDHPPAWALASLPLPLRHASASAKGCAMPLSVTYAYNHAAHHPLGHGITDQDLRLWGEDYYVARQTVEMPQEGNALPLFVVQTNTCIASPFLEVPFGKGRLLISALEMLEKISEHPTPLALLLRLAVYRPTPWQKKVGVAAADDSWRVYREVGLAAADMEIAKALRQEVALLDGERLASGDLPAIAQALDQGRTVVLHALGLEQTQQVLKMLSLPGKVEPGKAEPGEWDIFQHSHPLATGMANNYIYWISNKNRIAPWTRAMLHPQPASALVVLPKKRKAWQLTRRGALTVYPVGAGTLVIDNLRWQTPDLEEPERSRRYLVCLLTNLGVPLHRGADKRLSREYETAAERRERGDF